LILGALPGLEGKANLAFRPVYVQDLRADLLTLLHQLGGVLDLIVRQFADVDKAFDTFLQFHEHPEVGDVDDLALDLVARAILGRDRIPGIGLGLFDAKAETLVFLVNLKHLAHDLLALLEHLGGMLDAPGPGKVRNVDQTINAVLHPHEDPEGGDVADLARDLGPHGVFELEHVPGVGLGLLDGEADPAV
jgi:hypothetical protein